MNKVEKNKFPGTPVGLYLALSCGAFAPHEIWQSARFRARFFLRGLMMPVLTFRLLKIITQHPFYESLLSSQPRLPCRIHRPYLTNKLSRKERVAAIVYHYKAMTHFLSDAQFNKLLGDEGITMAQIVAKDDTVYTLNLISTHKLDREGEVSII
ncbi:MAG: DUF535 family protein, partial [Acinetobacter sp.]